MPVEAIKKFLKLESAGGIVLFFTAILAMICANSSLAFLHQHIINKFLFLTNDGLMTLFFLLVGLELKRGYSEGQLSNYKQVILPLMAAIGGMLIPVVVYLIINHSNPNTLKGWATPVATDIAFVMGVISLFGRRLPYGLKLFLLMLAIFDDIGAIIIIALLYSVGLSFFYLALSGLIFLALIALNKYAVKALTPYLFLGVLLWLSLLFSGVHPTIAGVLLALAVPNDPKHKLENALHPWVVFGIMPFFALINAGFSLETVSWSTLQSSIVLGICFGLFLGKQIGIFFFSWILIKLKMAKLPSECSYMHLYGGALLCGIGFTMSLFLGTLSFSNEVNYLAEVRLGVIIGSLLSGLAGTMMLILSSRDNPSFKE